MKSIVRTKIYMGNVELRSIDLPRYIKAGGVKVWVGDEFMELKPSDLKRGKYINTQHSKYNEGQTYQLIGYKWKPQGKQEELFNVNKGVLQGLKERYPNLIQKLKG